jgi:hypothetical protein
MTLPKPTQVDVAKLGAKLRGVRHRLDPCRVDGHGFPFFGHSVPQS